MPVPQRKTPVGNGENHPLGRLGYKFEAPLSSFNQERHKLIPLRFECRLTKAPAETGEYVFTCTWTNEDGKKLTASTDPLRIQGEE